MEKDLILLRRSRRAWEQLGSFRSQRKRCKDFAYGRQWDEQVLLSDGRVMSERQMFERQGRVPLTNNLIRQMLKGVIGRYRYLTADIDAEDADTSVAIRSVMLKDENEIENLDARALEEFLISGVAVQRVEEGKVENVSPQRVFWQPFLREDAGDCRFLGMVHRMGIGEAIRRFSGGDPRKVAEIMSIGERRGDEWWDVDEPDDERVSVIEVWRRRPRQLLRIFDPELSEYRCEEYSAGVAERVKKENQRRRRRGRRGIECRYDIAEQWEQTWLSAAGMVLRRTLKPEGTRPQIVVRCYPMIDGEVHSLVEDVMGQQRQVNRMMMLMDEILNASAKGVLLFPADQLPRGLTWRNVRDLWRQPGALIPFKRTSKHVRPMQVNTAGTSAGAAELLKTHLQMFDDISGTGRMSRERLGGTRGAETMRRELEESMLSVLDVLSSFRRFVVERDKLLSKRDKLLSKGERKCEVEK